MGINENFKARVTLKDATTGRLIDPTKYTSISVSYSVTNSVPRPPMPAYPETP